jgi:hypothetical protein
MSRSFLIALFVILLVLAILFVTQPQVLDKVWMWLVGFAGYIVLLVRRASDSLKGLFGKTPALAENGSPKNTYPDEPVFTAPSPVIDELKSKINELEERLQQTLSAEGIPLNSTSVTVLRYLDDGQTTLGLLFLRGRFFAYTLEDTHQKSKVPGHTRIPAGTYPLELNRVVTPLTERYRSRFSWFDFHIEVMDIPGFSRVYIHIGNSHADTEGCILIADGVNAADPQKMITHSRLAFERFYKTLHPQLDQGEKLSIQVMDEEWFRQAQLPEKTKELV